MLRPVAVIAFVTYATAARRGSAGLAVDLRHVARTVDGRELEVLTGRGFELHAATGTRLDPTMAELEADVRACIGPDEPLAGQTSEDAEAAHWRYVSEQLAGQGISLSADDARDLPHEVVVAHDPPDR